MNKNQYTQEELNYNGFIPDFLNESEKEKDLNNIENIFFNYFKNTNPKEKIDYIKLILNDFEQGDYKNTLTKDFLNSYKKELEPSAKKEKEEEARKYKPATFSQWADYLKHADDTRELFTPAILGHLITYRPGTFNLIVARPSTGKTTIQCDLIIEALEQGKKCIFFSIEEDAENIIDILVSAQYSFDTMHILEENIYSKQTNEYAGIINQCINNLATVEPKGNYNDTGAEVSFFAKMHSIGKAGKYSQNELFEVQEQKGKDYLDTLLKNFDLRVNKAIKKIMDALQSRQLVLFTDYDNISQIERITNLYTERGDLVFIDYAQIIDPPEGGRFIAEWEQLKIISKQLANLAKSTQTILLVSAQFNRQGQSDKDAKLSLANIAGADNFARDATSAIGLRSIDEKNVLTCTIMKNRKGIKNIEFIMAKDFARRYLHADHTADGENKFYIEYEHGTKKESKPKEKPVIKKPQSIADIANAY